MYKVVEVTQDNLEQKLNEVVENFPDSECEIIGITSYPGSSGSEYPRLIATLKVITLGQSRKRSIGQYKVIPDKEFYQAHRNIIKGYTLADFPGKFESYLNAINEDEGWSLLYIVPTYMLAVFGRTGEFALIAKAKQAGFEDLAEFAEFQKSRFNTKDEFVTFRTELARIKDTLPTQLNEIDKEADEEFAAQKYGEFIRLRDLSIEKLVKGISFIIFRKDTFKPKMIGSLIEDLQRAFQIQLADIHHYFFYRKIRNEYTHEHKKPEKNLADKAKVFFGELEKNLMDILMQVENNPYGDWALKEGPAPQDGKKMSLNNVPVQELQHRAKTLEHKILTENLTIGEENQIIAEIGELEETLRVIDERKTHSGLRETHDDNEDEEDLDDDD